MADDLKVGELAYVAKLDVFGSSTISIQATKIKGLGPQQATLYKRMTGLQSRVQCHRSAIAATPVGALWLLRNGIAEELESVARQTQRLIAKLAKVDEAIQNPPPAEII